MGGSTVPVLLHKAHTVQAYIFACSLCIATEIAKGALYQYVQSC